MTYSTVTSNLDVWTTFNTLLEMLDPCLLSIVVSRVGLSILY